MKKTLLIALLVLTASTSQAKTFDFKSYLYSRYDKGDPLIFKCIEASGFYDYIGLYGEEEMRWARYDNKGNALKAAWAKPEVTQDTMTLILDEEFDGSTKRVFRLLSKSGNKVEWQSTSKCTTTFN